MTDVLTVDERHDILCVTQHRFCVGNAEQVMGLLDEHGIPRLRSELSDKQHAALARMAHVRSRMKSFNIFEQITL